MAGENSPGQHGHVVLVLQETLCGVGDALVVVAHLEGDHRATQQGDALFGHALFGDLGLLHGEGERGDFVADRQYEGAMAGDNLEGQTVFGVPGATDEHGLVGRRNMPTEHDIPPCEEVIFAPAVNL